MVREAEDTYVYDWFFVIVLGIGAFFVLNLMTAVQFTYYDDGESKKDKATLERFCTYKRQVSKRQENGKFSCPYYP